MKSNRRLIQLLIFLGVLVLGGYAIGNSVVCDTTDFRAKDRNRRSLRFLAQDGKTHRLVGLQGQGACHQFLGHLLSGLCNGNAGFGSQYKKHRETSRLKLSALIWAKTI